MKKRSDLFGGTGGPPTLNRVQHYKVEDSGPPKESSWPLLEPQNPLALRAPESSGPFRWEFLTATAREIYSSPWRFNGGGALALHKRCSLAAWVVMFPAAQWSKSFLSAPPHVEAGCFGYRFQACDGPRLLLPAQAPFKLGFAYARTVRASCWTETKDQQKGL